MWSTLADEVTPHFAVVSPTSAVVRLVAALVLAGAIGFEREWRAKTAGLRTHMLIGIAAALFVLVGQEISALDFGNDSKRTDPIRLIEAVTAGVAFLGAGLIFQHQGKVRNVTTGASMWLAGAIGLTCGVGQVPLAAMATLITIGVIAVLGWAERHLWPGAGPEE
ncbi:MgtC/SapB family protein [Pelagovum pacificum]|uniref:Protein MgtC n=1 Tax=Pelagovum pacificum TaxID=2588711 RepID=A0A5C5GEF6_9RHOB|nr:MgtC/SapB family protein [Pelagovum pacificum]QQA43707.1 MgtC/SapB family protein [Pelagovum pacificum]TNY33162.1 MgtC/SapB family protein [Pelagovum pacificum]